MKYDAHFIRSSTPITKQDWPDRYIDVFKRVILHTNFPNNIGVIADKRACINLILNHCQVQADDIYHNSPKYTGLFNPPVVEGLMFERNNIVSGLYIRCMSNPKYAFFQLTPVSNISGNIFDDLNLNDVVF